MDTSSNNNNSAAGKKYAFVSAIFWLFLQHQMAVIRVCIPCMKQYGDGRRSFYIFVCLPLFASIHISSSLFLCYSAARKKKHYYLAKLIILIMLLFAHFSFLFIFGWVFFYLAAAQFLSYAWHILRTFASIIFNYIQ